LTSSPRPLALRLGAKLRERWGMRGERNYGPASHSRCGR
jgi:hypothetical protein